MVSIQINAQPFKIRKLIVSNLISGAHGSRTHHDSGGSLMSNNIVGDSVVLTCDVNSSTTQTTTVMNQSIIINLDAAIGFE